MPERRGQREEGKDQGTKAEHGIVREDEGIDLRGAKDALGSDNASEWLKDPKVNSADVDVAQMRQIDPERHAERPIWQ